MRVESNETEYCKLDVFYEADEEVVESKIDEAIAELRKVRIPGFRSIKKKNGDVITKAPDYAIKARCRNQIKNWVVREMGSQAFDDIIFETGIKSIGQPQFNDVKFKLNENKFSCKVKMFKKPEFELGEYSGFEIKKPEMNRDITQQVQEAIGSLLIRFGAQMPLEDNQVLQRGDQITMSFKGEVDGGSFDGGTSEGELYVIGRNRFPDFDDNIVGMKVGEEKEFEITMPEEMTNIGGKTVKFNVTILMASRVSPAEMDEDFFKSLNVSGEEELRKQLTEVVQKQVRDNESNALKNEAANKLVENHQIEVPSFLVDSEAKMMASQASLKFEDLDEKTQENVKKIAIDKVKLSLILDSIRDEEPDAVMSESEAQQAVVQRARVHGADANKFLVEAQRNGQIIGMISALRDEFTLDWVVKSCEIKDS